MSHKLPTCLAVMLLPSLGLAGPENTVSLDQYLLQLQTVGPRAIVSYCAAEVPALKPRLDAEYLRFADNMNTAMASLRTRLGARLAAPVTPAAGQVEEIGARMLAGVKQHPPETYCPWLLESMEKTSAASLQAKVEAAYARYEQLAAEHGGQ